MVCDDASSMCFLARSPCMIVAQRKRLPGYERCQSSIAPNTGAEAILSRLNLDCKELTTRSEGRLKAPYLGDGCYARIQRRRGTRATVPERYRDAGVARSVA